MGASVYPIAVTTGSSRWFVLSLALAAFVNMTGSLALGPFLAPVADELGTSVALLGQIPSLTMLLAAGLGLIVGPLADHYGYRRTLILSLLAVATSALGMALAAGFVPLLLAGLLGAVGRAAIVPTAQAVVAGQFRDEGRRRRAVGWIMTGHSSAVLLGIPLLTTIAAATSWRVAVAVLGGLGLGMALLARRTLTADRGQVGRPPGFGSILSAYAPLRNDVPTLGLLGASFVGGTGTWAIFTYLGAFLVQRHHFTTQQVGWGYLAVGVGIVLGTRLAGSRLGARARPLLIFSRAAGGLVIGTALVLPLPALVALGLLVLGAAADLTSATATAVLLAAESREARATTMTVNNACLSLGVAVGSALGGLTLSRADYPALGLISLTWLLGAAALAWRSRPRAVPAPAQAAL